MAKPRSKRSAKTASPPPKAISLRWAMTIPAALAAILALPVVTLGYYWDDFLYLTGGKAGGGPLRFLLPQAGEVFYRPFAQSVYFLFLRALDPSNGFLGHAVNLMALLAATAILVALASDLAGRRAGMLSGLVFAASGSVPSLVAWITCSQDLFAILFSLAALLLRHREREWAALACVAIALLSKETAIVVLPIVAAWDVIFGRPRDRVLRRMLPYVLLGLAWIAIHPGIHALADHGFRSGATGYVGVGSPEQWGTTLLRYFMILVNLPPAGMARAWPDDLSIAALFAVATLVAALVAFDHGPTSAPRDDRAKARPHLAWLALFIVVPTVLLPTIIVRIWVPYYAAFPAVGLALAAGPWLARRSKVVVAGCLALFTLLGVWSRGVAAPGQPVWCETTLKEASHATAVVRDHFRIAFPTIPSNSQVVLSIGESGTKGIRGTLVDDQALRVWYRDPTILTVSTLQRDPVAGPELLARVTSELEVIAIDPKTGAIRATGDAKPNWYLVGRTLRNYAREVVADGDLEIGIRIMDTLSTIEPPEVRSYNRRLVAMMLLAGGRRHAADSLLAMTPGFEKADAHAFVERLLAEASSSEALDLAAFEAFGVSADDPETLRWMVHEFQREGSTGQAAWWAGRLVKIAPGDREADAILKQAVAAGVAPNRVAE